MGITTLDFLRRQASQAALLAVRLGTWGVGEESELFCCPRPAGSNGRSERDMACKGQLLGLAAHGAQATRHDTTGD